MDASRYQSMSLNKTDANFKYELPESCYLSMMKKVSIDKMEAKYFLTSHPYPKLEGEMIIFKPKKADQTQGKEVMIYRDYSLRKRIETSVKTKNADSAFGRKNKSAEPEIPEPNMQCLEVDICEPLSRDEWVNFTKVVLETQGLGWFQVLPVGQKSSMPYQFNMMHVLP